MDSGRGRFAFGLVAVALACVLAGSPALARYASIVVDAEGLVYVADRQNRRVQIFDADGNYITERKYKGLPCGLYIADDQQMYMVSGFSGEILRLDEDGKAIGATGQPGPGLGEFGEAHYMTIASNGDIYVADTVKRALHKYVKM